MGQFGRGEKREELWKRDVLNPALPMISSTTSLSSSDRSTSSCSDISVDVNGCSRGEDSAVDGILENLDHRLNGYLPNHSLDSGVEGAYFGKPNNLKETHDNSDRDSVQNLEIRQTINGQESKINCDLRSSHMDDELDARFWEPPESEDPEDDVENSVAFNDDDDDCVDGMEWGKPTSLSHFGDHSSGSYRYKEERQKAMEEIRSGKFKAVVCQLLKDEGIDILGNDDESWLDIVTSLSWEAAFFLKPNATDGQAMDPDGYVKVKCIATGSRSESKVIKGLVFKKRAAHKHMPTKCEKPRLLLIRGVLGHSSSVLSSFQAMEQETDNLKSITEMIETCHPNLVLVEKSVSRDVQEFILAKQMTLVYDMKLHRLERVARCTGSPILSSDALTTQKLKQCDSFRIEKYVEQLAGSGEGGKKPSKTLLFIEGCPTRLGCTILLKGSHNNELKRIKNVVQTAVCLAYHLIVETSFTVDLKAMFSNVVLAGLVGTSPGDQPSTGLEANNANSTCNDEPVSESRPSTIDISISDEIDEESSHNLNIGLEGNSSFFLEPYNPAIFSGMSSLSASLKKIMGHSLPLASHATSWSLSNFLGFNGMGTNGQTSMDIAVSKNLEGSDGFYTEAMNDLHEKSLDDRQHPSLSSFPDVPPDGLKDVDIKENQVPSKDDVNVVLNSRSILVLMSSRNALRGTICEQSRFSHIMFYRRFDIPLGKFLRDNLLNQRRQCITCGELTESHFYYYAHHNKQLTIQVKRLSTVLPGQAEGKIWMWSRCGKCKCKNGGPKSTKRVLVSALAWNFSFGKFLELSFSGTALSGISSSCGHSIERYFSFFFGLGQMAAMFKFSPVTTYKVSLPPQKLEFSNCNGDDAFKQELAAVSLKGENLFCGVEDLLKRLRSHFVGVALKLGGLSKEFSDVEAMLKQETSEFKEKEAGIGNMITSGNKGNSIYKFLRLNWLVWELLLEAYVWDRRVHSLLLLDPFVVGIGDPGKEMQKPNANGTISEGNSMTEAYPSRTPSSGPDLTDVLGAAVKEGKISIKEIADEDPDIESEKCSVAEYSKRSTVKSLQDANVSEPHLSNGDSFKENNGTLPGHFQEEIVIPISADGGSSNSIVDPDILKRDSSPPTRVSRLKNSNEWLWMPFSEIQQRYMKDLQRGISPRFQPVSNFQEHGAAGFRLLMEEGSRLHISLGADGYIVRDYDAELSSIIACALAYLKDLPNPSEFLNDDGRKETDMTAKSQETSHILSRIPTMISPHLPSYGTSDSDSLHNLSISREESRLSSFDGLNLLESLVPPENLSPEVSLGVTKSFPKGKYSVICLYAKQFQDLRNRCCPELQYIASICRCKNWDAKGGKSKSFFAKTLDDRFILKEIKKTEFESFVKFAPHYFKYMNEAMESGNQTCLAKILGIYQVILRQTKSGKEMKHDLMIMENLSFGRKITRQYDLKGALHARFNSSVDNAADVLLDQNFVDDMNCSPLYVSNTEKRLLGRAVWNDTTFLTSINVMDYSLLVGVDTNRQELVCGIIDYLRQYTWDKQLETWVKTSLVVPRNVSPTIISPKEYKKRFRKFMSTHFLSVPDEWCKGKSPGDPCELCGFIDNNSSSHLESQKQVVNGFSHQFC